MVRSTAQIQPVKIAAFHGDRPGLWKSLHPTVKLGSRCSDLAFPVDLTAHILTQ
jgi:hypothetical protein